jgi:hypothetical protein
MFLFFRSRRESDFREVFPLPQMLRSHPYVSKTGMYFLSCVYLGKIFEIMGAILGGKEAPAGLG